MKELVLPILVSFAISAIFTPIFIPILRNLKASNTEREEGVKEHLKKAGTPTMGGVVFVLAIVISSLVFMGDYKQTLPVVIVTVAFGLIGFLDDFLKVVLKSSDGLLAWQKFGLQFIITIGFAVYLEKFSDISLSIILPGGSTFSLGWFAIPLMFLCVLGTVNGVNFTDGIDGLASTITIVVALFFTIMSVVKGGEITPVTCSVVGALLGFLIFNSFKAKIFMGDTGSLALGGFVAASAYMLNMPIIVILIGFVYLAEVLSVIIQVTYFKKTGGKRIFKMTPIHHHFELCGWSEAKIVAIFSITTVILCLIGLLIMC